MPALAALVAVLGWRSCAAGLIGAGVVCAAVWREARRGRGRHER